MRTTACSVKVVMQPFFVMFAILQMLSRCQQLQSTRTLFFTRKRTEASVKLQNLKIEVSFIKNGVRDLVTNIMENASE